MCADCNVHFVLVVGVVWKWLVIGTLQLSRSLTSRRESSSVQYDLFLQAEPRIWRVVQTLNLYRRLEEPMQRSARGTYSVQIFPPVIRGPKPNLAPVGTVSLRYVLVHILPHTGNPRAALSRQLLPHACPMSGEKKIPLASHDKYHMRWFTLQGASLSEHALVVFL